MIVKEILRALFYLLLFINIFLLNVLGHEFGHYMAADYYGLEPNITLDFGAVGDLGFGFESVPIASTSFNNPNSLFSLVGVILMGPFFNLVLGLIFTFSLFYPRLPNFLKEIMIIGFVTSISSFLMNIVPIGGADGSLLFKLI